MSTFILQVQLCRGALLCCFLCLFRDFVVLPPEEVGVGFLYLFDRFRPVREVCLQFLFQARVDGGQVIHGVDRGQAGGAGFFCRRGPAADLNTIFISLR